MSGQRCAARGPTEWVRPDAPPVVLVHGGGSTSRARSTCSRRCSPPVATAWCRGIIAVMAIRSTPTLYSWLADERDLLAVVDSVTARPSVRGDRAQQGRLDVAARDPGADFLRTASAATSRIDGLPFPSLPPPPRRSLERERYHDAAGRDRPPAGSIIACARASSSAPGRARSRRWPSAGAKMNPRLSHEWLLIPRRSTARCLRRGRLSLED